MAEIEPAPPKPTLGQVAYEGYCARSNWKSLVSGAPLPQWHEQSFEIQWAWEAAADAVMYALQKG